MSAEKVAILGTRYADFSIEEQALGPLGVSLVSGDGSSAEAIVEEAADATVVLAGSRPRSDASVLEQLTCRGIIRYGVGTDSIDLNAARRLSGPRQNAALDRGRPTRAGQPGGGELLQRARPRAHPGHVALLRRQEPSPSGTVAG